MTIRSALRTTQPAQPTRAVPRRTGAATATHGVDQTATPIPTPMEAATTLWAPTTIPHARLEPAVLRGTGAAPATSGVEARFQINSMAAATRGRDTTGILSVPVGLAARHGAGAATALRGVLKEGRWR